MIVKRISVQSADGPEIRTPKASALGVSLDRAIAPLFPGWARRRQRSRLLLLADDVRREVLSTYAAAEKGRLMKDWGAKTKSADEAILEDAATLNARARAAVRDDWSARSAVDAFKRHVVGIGISACSAAYDPETGEELADFNEQADWLWHRWARSPRLVDVEGRKNLLGFQRLLIQELVAVGEAMFILAYEARDDQVGLVLQAFEPEQLDTTRARDAGTGNEIRGGIEINGYGRAVAYHIRTQSAQGGGYSFETARVPAERVVHLMDPDRVRQTRGVTRLSPVLARMRHLGMYEEFELLAKRMEACIGLIVKQSALGDAPLGTKPPDGSTGEDARGTKEIQFEPGMVPRLAEGEDVQAFNPQRPGMQYASYTGEMKTEIAAGVGLDFAMLCRDFSKGNFSSQRQGLTVLWAETDMLEALMVDLALRPIRNAFIGYAILEGRLEAPEYFTSPEWRDAYLEAEWRGPPKRWIDPLREANAEKIAIEMRLKTRREIYNERGEDWRDNIRQIAAEQKMADDLEVYLPEAAPAAPRGVPAPPSNGPGGNGDGAPGGNGKPAAQAMPRRRF